MIKKIQEKSKKLFKSFPITIGLTYLLTILYVILGEGLSLHVWRILLLTIVGTYMGESLFKDKKKNLVCTIFFGISIILDVLVKGLDSRVGNNILISYSLVIFIITIYNHIKNNKKDIREYVLNIFNELFYTIITYGLITIGIFVLIVLFDWLIMNNYSDSIMRLIILPLGLYLIPNVLFTLKKPKEKEDRFMKNLILYVLVPMTLIMLIIMYIYSLKIMITGVIPENVITETLIIIYLVTILVYNLSYKYKNNTLGKVGLMMPYIYIPLIILEVYSLSLRINTFGITPTRYFGMLFIIFEFINIAFVIYKKGDKLIITLPIIIVLSLIYLISPINYITVSMWSQESIVNEYLSGKNVNARGAYDYLASEPFAREFIKNIPKDKFKEIHSEYYTEDTNAISYSKDFNSIEKCNISEYSHITSFEANGDASNTYITINNKKIDLSNIVDGIMDNSKHNSIDKYFEDKEIIKVDDNTGVYITDVYIKVNKNNEVVSTYLSGYALYK